MMPNFDRQLLSLTADELEKFVRDWALQKKTEYHKVEKFTGTGDRGRDVVGFLTASLHEGDWDNYQCKQFGKTLPTSAVFHEIGKVLYYADQGEFTAPRYFKFVAPKGINRNALKLFFKPIAFKQALIDGWKEYCENTIIDGSVVALTPSLLKVIQDYDFSRIIRVGIDDILDDAAAKHVLFKWFKADPGPAPIGVAPEKVQDAELPYVRQLLYAYSTREGTGVADHVAATAHTNFGPHFARQRERFYDADAFKRFYRDNTDIAVVEAFESDIYHGVVDTCDGEHKDPLARADAVMAQAANVQPSGILALHSRVKVKQGICHHFANEVEPRLVWRRP
jgi:hypothetical protein